MNARHWLVQRPVFTTWLALALWAGIAGAAPRLGFPGWIVACLVVDALVMVALCVYLLATPVTLRGALGRPHPGAPDARHVRVRPPLPDPDLRPRTRGIPR